MIVQHTSIGRTIIGSILGVMLGMFMPFAFLMESMVPMLLLPVLWAIGSYIWFGATATVVFSTAYLTAMYMTFGGAGLFAGSVAVFPLLISVLWGGKTQEAFFDQLQRGIMISILSAAGTVVIAVAFYGTDLIGRGMDALRTQIQAIPDDIFSMVMAYSGLSTEEISVSDFRTLYEQVLTIIEENMNFHLPGRFLAGTTITAILGVLWFNWLLAKRGLVTVQSFVPIRDWHLPKHITIGAVAAVAISFVFVGTNQSIAATIFYTVYDLACVAFGTQFAAALSRRFQRSNMTGTGRNLLIALAIIVPTLFGFPFVPCALGLASALFGSNGLFHKKQSGDESVDKKQ